MNYTYEIKHGSIAAVCKINIIESNEVCEVIYISELDMCNDELSGVKFNTLPVSVQQYVKNQFRNIFLITDLITRRAYVKQLFISVITC